jgi:hypothetical protein
MDEIIITNEEEYDRAAEELFELTAKDNPTDREQGYIDRLTDAIVKWDDEHYPHAEPSPRTKMLISDALGDDPEKARKAMEELNWHDAEEDRG